MRRLPLLVVLLVAVATSQALAADLDATLKKIKRSKTITLGYHESARPFSFASAEGKPMGYSVDLCTLVAAGVGQQLGLTDLEILDITQAGAFFAWANRLMLTLGEPHYPLKGAGGPL